MYDEGFGMHGSPRDAEMRRVSAFKAEDYYVCWSNIIFLLLGSAVGLD